MSERAILDANDAFYAAFSSGDVGAMDAQWARHAAVSCAHPSWDLLIGRRDVMASWLAILSGGAPTNVRCEDPRAVVSAELGVVTCTESIGEARVFATNVFVKEDGEWRIVHHHGGRVR